MRIYDRRTTLNARSRPKPCIMAKLIQESANFSSNSTLSPPPKSQQVLKAACQRAAKAVSTFPAPKMVIHLIMFY